jgi:hypothetical protein
MKSEQQLLEELYTQLILEKDHRQKLIKFGIPEDVADFLHRFNDKYSLWFGDKINRMEGFRRSNGKINWINTNILTQMQGIMDWVSNVPNVQLKQYDWSGAVNQSREYHEKLESSSLEGSEKNKIIKKYDNGFYWVDLETTRDTSEGSLMGHCATTHKAETLYSLRKYDQHTQSIDGFVTIAASPNEGVWYQCKSKKNSKPKPEYYPFIADILVSHNMLTYKHEYNSTHDFTNVDLTEYVKGHEEDFENSDDILEKISENNIGYADFEKVYKQYSDTLNYYGIYLNDSDYEESMLFVDYSFYYSARFDEMGVPDLEGLINTDDVEISKKFRKELGNLLNTFDVDASEYDLDVENDYQDSNSFNIQCQASEDDRTFYYNDEGLRSFEQTCSYYKRLNENFDNEKFKEKFQKLCIKIGWITNPITKLKEVLTGEYYSDEEGEVDLSYKTFNNIEYVNFDNDMNLTITFKPFPIQIEQEILDRASKVKTLLLNNYKIFPYTLTDNVYENYSYIVDFFKFFDFIFNDQVDYFRKNIYVAFDNMLIKTKKTYHYDDSFELEREVVKIEKFDNFYPTLIENFNRLVEYVTVKYLKNVRKIDEKDVYYDKELADNLSKEKSPHEIKEISYYEKDTDQKIGDIFFFEPSEIDERIKDAVKKYHDEIYPKYSEKLYNNFIQKEYGGEQLKFKDFFDNR